MIYELVWQEGLCRHGCGEALNTPKRRFVNGHDAKLLDTLLDAHRDGALIRVRNPGAPVEEAAEFSAEGWARIAFFPKGLRWFRIKAGVADPAPEEARVVAWARTDALDMGTPEAYSLDDDLATVREIVARAAESPTVEAFERLRDELVNLRRSHEELAAHADLMEAELAEALEHPATLVVTQEGIDQLTNEQARTVMLARASAAKDVFSRARYNGDIREMQDLLTLFRSTGDPVRLAAMRALLGQAVR